MHENQVLEYLSRFNEEQEAMNDRHNVERTDLLEKYRSLFRAIENGQGDMLEKQEQRLSAKARQSEIIRAWLGNEKGAA